MVFWKNPYYTPPGPQKNTLLPGTVRSRLQWVQGLEKVDHTVYGYEKVECTVYGYEKVDCTMYGYEKVDRTMYGYEKVDCSMCEVKIHLRQMTVAPG